MNSITRLITPAVKRIALCAIACCATALFAAEPAAKGPAGATKKAGRAPLPAIPEPNYVSIFNGKDLTGWTERGDLKLWRAENGVLVGQSDAKKTGSTLATNKSYTNFVLQFDVKYLPPGDSGVTFRSPGLQVQIGTSHANKIELTGSFTPGGAGYPDEGLAKDAWKYYFPGIWNTLRIDAVGSAFFVSINGHRVSSYYDPRYTGAAPISVQVHQDMDMKIEFRNIQIAELP